MKNALTLTVILSLACLLGCPGATLGTACENIIGLCSPSLDDDATGTAVDTCVDASFDDADEDKIECGNSADSCAAAIACGLYADLSAE